MEVDSVHFELNFKLFYFPLLNCVAISLFGSFFFPFSIVIFLSMLSTGTFMNNNNSAKRPEFKEKFVEITQDIFKV